MNNRRRRKPIVLVILDGWGYTKERRGNPFMQAKTPYFNYLYRHFPHTFLQASGKAVGLPPHQAGNSEAGHLNIGAGRIIEQDSVRISHSINDGTFFKNAALQAALIHVKTNNSNLHLMGLLTGDQSAHSDPDHFLALLSLARVGGAQNVYIHFFTDGRDSQKYAAIGIISKLQKVLPRGFRIATIMGRYYAMDRVKEWSRTQLAYDTLVFGKGLRAKNAEQAILKGYNRGESDEYLQPTVIAKDGRIERRISNDDAVIYFNLRSDRVRQLTKAFVQDNQTFAGFRRKKVLKNLRFVSLTDFGPDLPGVLCAYPSQRVHNSLPVVLSGMRQLYISESEKFAHVTYFFNGGYANPVAGEERVMIKSPSVTSYDKKPQMSGSELTNTLFKAIKKNIYDFILVNYPNLDMIAHTGNIPAAIRACEYVDSYLRRIIPMIYNMGGIAFVTGDHGNIEQMLYPESNEIETAHSMSPVPFFVIGKRLGSVRLKQRGILADIAPTILRFMHIDPPPEMQTRNLCLK